jgi:uracil-DNA glycosylase
MDEYAPGKVAKDLADIESEAEAGGCVSCGLCNSRSTAVFGSGDPDPRLMFVGEGLGAEEDRQGLPFVGAAGELLTKIRTTYHPAALLRYPK